jgi:tetratricopeptide (TPR) repeat protein
MKRLLFLICILGIPIIIAAQQPVDYLLRSKALKESGRTDEAISLLSEAIGKFNDYRLFIERADDYLIKGEVLKSGADYDASNLIIPGSGEYGHARIEAFQGNPVKSLNHLENNLSSTFKKGEKEVLLDNAFSSIENTPEWRLFWKKERYSFPEKKISEIEYYASIGKTEEAANVLNELLSTYNNEDITEYGKAIVYLSQGKFNDCIVVLTKLLDKDSKNENYLRLIARAQANSGNNSGATVTYSQLIGMDIPDAGLLMLRAESYYKTGEADNAMKDLLKYLYLYPENKKALSLAGKIEALTGDNLKAIDYFTKNLKLHPNDPDCYIERANSYFVSKTWGSAIDDYAMALDIQPANSETWLNKGIALINNGKKEDGCHDINMALSLGNKKATSYQSRYCIR